MADAMKKVSHLGTESNLQKELQEEVWMSKSKDSKLSISKSKNSYSDSNDYQCNSNAFIECSDLGINDFEKSLKSELKQLAIANLKRIENINENENENENESMNIHGNENGSFVSGPFHVMLYGLNAINSRKSCAAEDELEGKTKLNLNLIRIEKERWRDYSEKIVKRVLHEISGPYPSISSPSSPSAPVILSVRLMVSPPKSPAQSWHLDYAGTSAKCRSVFVNVSKSTFDNCTEHIEFLNSDDEIDCINKSKMYFAKRRTEEVNLDDREVLENSKQGEPEVEAEDSSPVSPCLKSEIDLQSLPSISDYEHKIGPLIGDEFSIFHALTCQKFHRRSENRSDFTRITLGIDYSLEESSAENFVCIDTKYSIGKGDSVVGKDIIDSLDDYDLRIRE